MTFTVGLPAARAAKRWSGPVAVLVVCAVLFVWPVVMVVVGAFRTGSPSEASTWSVAGITRVFTAGRTYSTLVNSIVYAVSVSALSLMLAAYLAWLVARTDTPLRRLVLPAAVIVLAMPQLFFAISWDLIGNRNVGLANQFLQSVTGTGWAPVNAASWPGMIFVTTLRETAIKFLLLFGPFLAMDRAQEEAAHSSGAGHVRTFFTVTLRALAPALLGVLVLGVVTVLEYFDLPLILGLPPGIQVFSTEIYNSLEQTNPPDFTGASSLSLGLLVIMLLLIYTAGKVRGERSYVSTTGKARAQRAWSLGRWRYLGSGVIAGYLLLAIVLPVTELVLVSLSPYTGVYRDFSAKHFVAVLSDPQVSGAVQTTLLVALTGGLLTLAVTTALVFTIRYRPGPVARFVRFVTWLPWSLPGTAIALGILWAYVSFPPTTALYGTTVLLVLGLVVSALPVAMRAVEPAVVQIGGELEEAAWVSGRRRSRAFVEIVARLCVPSLLAGFLLSAIVISGNLAMPLILGSTQTRTLPSVAYELYHNGQAPQAAALLVLMIGAIAALSLVAAIALKIIRKPARKPDSQSEPAHEDADIPIPHA